MSNEADISKLRIVVESKTDGIVDKLTSLASALETLKNASKGSFKGLENCAKAISNLADAVSKINDADVDRLERMAEAVSKMSGVRFSSSFFRAMGGSGSTKGGGLTIGGRFSNGRGWTWADNGRASSGTILLGGGSGSGSPPIDIDGLFSGKGGKSGGASSAVFANARAKLNKFTSSVLRIATYRLIRRALMLIVNAFKEGLKNAKEWSRINNTQLYESMKRLSAAGLAMKNALGAALGELLISLEPMLERLSLRIADLGNRLANFFATLRGAGEYQKAITDVNKLADAQERLNRALLGFDEINKLSGAQDVNDYFTMEQTDKGEAWGTGAKIAGGIAAFAIAKGALKYIGNLFGIGGGAAGGATLFSKIGVLIKNGFSSIVTTVKGLFGTGAAGGGVAALLPYVALIAELVVWAKLFKNNWDSTMEKIANGTLGRPFPEVEPRELTTAEVIKYNLEHPDYQLPLYKTTGEFPWAYEYDKYRTMVNGTNDYRSAEDAILKIIVQNPNGQTLNQTEMYYNDILNGRVGQVVVPGSPYIGR